MLTIVQTLPQINVRAHSSAAGVVEEALGRLAPHGGVELVEVAAGVILAEARAPAPVTDEQLHRDQVPVCEGTLLGGRPAQYVDLLMICGINILV